MKPRNQSSQSRYEHIELGMEPHQLPCYSVGQVELAIIITEIKSSSKQRFRNSKERPFQEVWKSAEPPYCYFVAI
jgi:hypothetical protein